MTVLLGILNRTDRRRSEQAFRVEGDGLPGAAETARNLNPFLVSLMTAILLMAGMQKNTGQNGTA